MIEEGGFSEAGSGRILVVDDNEANRLLLRELLELHGHEVRLAAGGAEAIEQALGSDPDLLLLDVNMPEVNGLEVCRRLRADPRTAALPIILVTALTYRHERLEGIAAGANDYLTKPIDSSDLLLRVGNALRMRKLHRELGSQYVRLQRLEQLRDSLVHMLVHDLRTPLTAITVYLDLVRSRLAELGEPELLADFESMAQSVNVLTDMVSNVLDVSRLEADAMPLKPVILDLRAVAANALHALGVDRNGRVELLTPAEPVAALGDEDLMRRVIANLVGNAIKFSPRESKVRVAIGTGDSGPEVRVADRGPGIPAEAHAHIFEKFGQVESGKPARVPSTGLGLTFCKLAIEAHRGRIGVESTIGQGSIFWFTLPPVS